MILVIGGAYQGKTDYVCGKFHIGRDQIADGAVCGPEEIREAAALNHFHLLVKRLVKEGKDPIEAARKILEENPELIIITNELGYGVVPVDPFDRAWREAAGRTCCVLAAEAGQVYRVICGLGQALKR